MMRGLGAGGVLRTLVGPILLSGAVAGPSIAANLAAPAWAIAPEDAACRMEFELTGRSGAIAPVALVSDGYRVALRFAKAGMPAEAFLPIRVDGKPFANLVQRAGEEGIAVMSLSDETLGAMRHGKTLQIAWLSEESVSGSLAGAGQGISDLKTCGAQVAADHRAREAELEASRARQAAEARAKAVSDEQLRAARAQTAAADAERQRVAALAQRATAEAEELAAQAEQQRAYADAERQRAADEQRQRAVAQQYYYQDRAPPPPAYSYYRPYYSPR